MAVTHIFSPRTKIKSSEVNQNFTDLSGKKIYMHLFSRDFSTTSTTWVEYVGTHFYFEPTSNIESIIFAGSFRSTSSGTPVYMRLYNKTDDSEVCVLSTTSDDEYNIVKSANIIDSIPTTEKKYTIWLRTSNSSVDVYAYNAFFIITYK